VNENTVATPIPIKSISWVLLHQIFIKIVALLSNLQITLGKMYEINGDLDLKDNFYSGKKSNCDINKIRGDYFYFISI
jgi:hypothetical protein